MAKKIYEEAEAASLDILTEAMATYHPHLSEVRIAMTMARAFDKDDEPIPCVKFAGGHQAAAVTRIIPLKRRVYMHYEAEIEVDGLIWDHLNRPSRVALMDHELNHIRLSTDPNGVPRLDDRGRPKLKLIKDDWMINGFVDVIRRHGDDAMEWRSVTRVYAVATEAHQYHQEQHAEPVAA